MRHNPTSSTNSSLPTQSRRGALLLAALFLLAFPETGHCQKIELRSTFRPPVKGETFLHASGFSRNGMTFAIACQDGRKLVYLIYDTETLQETDRWETDYRSGRPASLLFSPNGRTLIAHNALPTRVVGDNRRPSTLEFWDMELKKRVRRPLLLAPLEGTRAHLTRDGKTVVLPGEGHVLLVDALTGKPRTRFQAGCFAYCPSALSPDGRFLALQEKHHRCLGIYDLTSGKRLHSLRPFPKDEFPEWFQNRFALAFLPDGKSLSVLSNLEWESVEYDVLKGTESARQPSERMPRPRALASTADAKYLVQVGGNNPSPIAALSTKTGKLTFPARRVRCSVDQAAISPDGQTVVMLQNFPDAILVWRVVTKKEK